MDFPPEIIMLGVGNNILFVQHLYTCYEQDNWEIVLVKVYNPNHAVCNHAIITIIINCI